MSKKTKEDNNIWKTVRKYRKRLTLSSVPIVLASIYYLRQIFSSVDLISLIVPVVFFFTIPISLYYVPSAILIVVFGFLGIFYRYRTSKGKQIGDLINQVRQLQNDLNGYNSKVATLTKQTEELKNRISDKESVISKTDTEKGQLTNKIKELENQLRIEKDQNRRLREDSAELLRKIEYYKNPPPKRIP